MFYHSFWWWIRGVNGSNFRAICERCGQTGQAHWAWRGCRRFKLSKTEHTEPPKDPVFCKDCSRCRLDTSSNDQFQFAGCDMGEPSVKYSTDYVSGGKHVTFLKDERRFCKSKNEDGQCKDFILNPDGPLPYRRRRDGYKRM